MCVLFVGHCYQNMINMIYFSVSHYILRKFPYTFLSAKLGICTYVKSILVWSYAHSKKNATKISLPVYFRERILYFSVAFVYITWKPHCVFLAINTM